MTRMTGPDCVVMCNLINTYIHTYIHYTNTRVKLTIVTCLSFSERIAIANLSYSSTVLIIVDMMP